MSIELAMAEIANADADKNGDWSTIQQLNYAQMNHVYFLKSKSGSELFIYSVVSIRYVNVSGVNSTQSLFMIPRPQVGFDAVLKLS